jgi:hypothetical protein
MVRLLLFEAVKFGWKQKGSASIAIKQFSHQAIFVKL